MATNIKIVHILNRSSCHTRDVEGV